MTGKTFLYLESYEPTQVSWVVVNENNEILHQAIRSNNIDLPKEAKQNPITVIILPQDCIVTTIQMPKLSKQRLLQALPFALEEKLVEDVNTLHFAIAPYQEDGTVPVAVIAKHKMQQWFTLLNQFGITPDKMIPGIFALPAQKNIWNIYINENISAIRTDFYNGYICDKANLVTFLQLLLEQSATKPETIEIYHLPQETIEPLSLQNIIVNKHRISETALLGKINHWLDTYPSIDLLQGEFKTRKKATHARKIWRAAIGLSAIWVGLFLTSQMVSVAILQHQSRLLETAILKIYRQQFPEATTVTAPKARMENALKILTEQSHKNYFLSLLAEIGQPLSQNKAIRLQHLEFHNQQLVLDVTAANFEHLDQFIQSLAHQGLVVKQQNATTEGLQIKASVYISRGAA